MVKGTRLDGVSWRTANGESRRVYRANVEHACSGCGGVISKNEQYTHASGMQPICRACHLERQENGEPGLVVRLEEEVAYRKGYLDATEQVGHFVTQLLEQGSPAFEIKQLIAAYKDHVVLPWRLRNTSEPAPTFNREQCRAIVSEMSAKW